MIMILVFQMGNRGPERSVNLLEATELMMEPSWDLNLVWPQSSSQWYVLTSLLLCLPLKNTAAVHGVRKTEKALGFQM